MVKQGPQQGKSIQDEIPKILAATHTDQCQFALGRYLVNQLHLILKFDGPLETERLKKTLCLALDAEPVLGCRFVPGFFRARWERLPDAVLGSQPLLEVKAGNEAECLVARDRFLAKGLDEQKGPQMRALLMKGAGADTLVIKVSHMAGDAAGIRDVGYLVANLYRKLGKDPGFRPQPNTASRSLRPAYQRFSLWYYLKSIPYLFVQMTKRSRPKRCLLFPMKTETKGEVSFLLQRIPAERVTAMKEATAKTGATLNDLLTTALMRTLAVKGRGGTGIRLVQTADLRRYIPGGRAPCLCHMSSLFLPSLGTEPGKDFPETLARVKKDIDSMKAGHMALVLQWFTRRMAGWMPFGVFQKLFHLQWDRAVKQQNAAMVMTNMGPVDPVRMDFGEPSLLSADLVVCPLLPPLFCVGISGFSGSLFLSAGYWESAITAQEVQAIFDRMVSELPGA